MGNRFIHPAAEAVFASDKMKKTNLFESKNMFCDVYCLEPGQEQKAHDHAENDKIYCALEGTCMVQIGDDIRPLEPGRLAIAPAGVIHGVVNQSSQRAMLLVMMAPHPNFKGD